MTVALVQSIRKQTENNRTQDKALKTVLKSLSKAIHNLILTLEYQLPINMICCFTSYRMAPIPVLDLQNRKAPLQSIPL